MSRRIRVNLTRWVCRKIGHAVNPLEYSKVFAYCDRCGRVW